MIQTVKSKLSAVWLAIVALVLFAPCGFAAVPAAYTDAIDTMETDATSLITTAIAALLALAAILTLGFFAIKLLRKARSAG